MGFLQVRRVFDKPDFYYMAEVDFQMEAFSAYIKLTNGLIENNLQSQIKEYEEILQRGNQSEVDSAYDFEDHEIKSKTRQLFYDSIFISMFSFLEKKMHQLSHIAEENYKIKVKDLSGDGVTKYYNYLKKVAEIDMEILNGEWELIKNLNRLRNLLVHKPFAIIDNKGNSGIIKSLKKIEHLTVIERQEYTLLRIDNSKLLLDFCSSIQKFLLGIYLEEAKIRRQGN